MFLFQVICVYKLRLFVTFVAMFTVSVELVEAQCSLEVVTLVYTGVQVWFHIPNCCLDTLTLVTWVLKNG